MAGAAATADAVTTNTGYPTLAIGLIESSGLNPRTHWNDTDDRELQESIRAEGVIEPILVRPHAKGNGKFQIVAGERRFRAAKAVGLEQIPTMIKIVSDEKLLELALTENIQRRSMHPLDEANGFIKRLEMGGCSPEALAHALGLSKRYVTDRIRLKKLSAKAAQMLEAGAMTVSHAIILAKLDPKLQDEAIRDTTDYQFDFDDHGKQRKTLQPVMALKQWVDDHVPLDPASPEAQEEFPQLVEASTEAAATGATVVMLSTNRTPWQHKAKPGDPLFGDKWERCKKTDKAAQIGVIVEGVGRGERVYFKPLTPPKRAASSTGGPQGGAVTESAAERTKRIEREKRDAAARKREREREEHWKKARTDAKAAIASHIAAAPIAKVLSGLIASCYHRYPAIRQAKTAEALVRAMAAGEAAIGDYSVEFLHRNAQPFGFDVKKWFDARLKAHKAVHALHAPKKAKKR
jgi:ParB/RepB/Spo0J family partition protein